MASKKAPKALGFEQGLDRLETIAVQMERAELPLEELLKLYEEGMKLSAELAAKLDEAEGRMQEIAMREGGQALVPADIVQQQSLLDGLDHE